jgi:hypothetical protein
MRKVLLEMVGVRSEAEWDEMLEARRRARKRAYDRAYYQKPEVKAHKRTYQRAWYAKRAKHPEARRT